MATFSFKGPGGSDPATYTLQLSRAFRPTVGDVTYAAGRQRTRILKRNERGVDVNGSKFKRYTDSYAKFREDNGRNADPVDLTYTGLMNKAMLVTVGGVQGTGIADAPAEIFALGFYGEEAIRARAHNEGRGNGKSANQGSVGNSALRNKGGLPKRYFFGASEQDLQNMQIDIGTHIQARLSKLI